MQPTRIPASRVYDYPALKMSEVKVFIEYLLHPETGFMAGMLKDVQEKAQHDGHPELLDPYMRIMAEHIQKIHERTAVIDLNVSWGAPISGLIVACGVLSETLCLVDHMFLENYNKMIKDGILTPEEITDAKLLFEALLRVQSNISMYITGLNWLGMGAMPIANLTDPSCEQVAQMEDRHGIDLHLAYQTFTASAVPAHQQDSRSKMADSEAVHLLIANFQAMILGVAETMSGFEADYVALRLTGPGLRLFIRNTLVTLGEHVVPKMPQLHCLPAPRLEAARGLLAEAAAADPEWTMLTPAFDQSREAEGAQRLNTPDARKASDQRSALGWK